MSNDSMFKTQCAKCGKEMFTFAKDRLGTLPVVYCSKICEGQARYEKRFDKRFK